jgi:hypothetical protein
MRARGELRSGAAEVGRRFGRDAPKHPDRVGVPLPNTSLGLCDACHVAWGVEMWLHPGDLLVMVLCHHHSRQQAVALQENRWSRLVRPRWNAVVTC